MIIDTHTHAWGTPSREHPWVNGPLVARDVNSFSVDVVYGADRLLDDMDARGIDRAVVVGYPICEWTDNDYTIRAVQDHDRLTGIVMLDPFPDEAAETLREHMRHDGILGFRLGAICPRDAMWERFDPGVEWLREAIGQDRFWDAARDTDAVCQILAHEDQLDQVIELVDAHPDIRYLIDHFAHADPRVKPDEAPFSALSAFSSVDNVGVKVSEIVHRSRGGYPYRDMHDHVHWFLDHFDSDRVFWGSDFPNVSDEATYEQSLRWLDHVDGISDRQRRRIKGEAFREWSGMDTS